MGEIQLNNTLLQQALQQLLQGNAKSNTDNQLNADLDGLFNTLNGVELVEAVIYHCQLHKAEALGMNVDDDFSKLAPVELGDILFAARNELKHKISSFISDHHRCFIVQHHALGLPTSEAVDELIRGDDVMNRLAQEDAIGYKVLRDILIHRMSYLKPGAPRWSEKKYGAVYQEARQEYKQAIADIPLASQQEQVALLAEHADRLNKELKRGGLALKDYTALSNELRKTVVSLRKMTAGEDQQILTNLSDPKFVAVIERLTAALKAPDQQILDGEVKELVTGLEQLTVALQLPAQQSNSVKALPAEADSTTDQTHPAPYTR